MEKLLETLSELGDIITLLLIPFVYWIIGKAKAEIGRLVKPQLDGLGQRIDTRLEKIEDQIAALNTQIKVLQEIDKRDEKYFDLKIRNLIERYKNRGEKPP